MNGEFERPQSDHAVFELAAVCLNYFHDLLGHDICYIKLYGLNERVANYLNNEKVFCNFNRTVRLIFLHIMLLPLPISSGISAIVRLFAGSRVFTLFI